MNSFFTEALRKVVLALEIENIAYMLVGGFAVSYYNRARTTNDIDIVLQILPEQVSRLLVHFPKWKGFEDAFREDVRMGSMFNITNFESGVRYDFMTFQNTAYGREAFGRRKLVDFSGISCFISSKEDLIISKLKWYNISQSDKQMEDLRFLLLDTDLDLEYVKLWTNKLKLNDYGLLG